MEAYSAVAESATSDHGRASMTCQPNDVCTGPTSSPGTAVTAASTNVASSDSRAWSIGMHAPLSGSSSAPPVSAAAGSIERAVATSANRAPASISPITSSASASVATTMWRTQSSPTLAGDDS